MAEINVAIICACMPAFSHMLRHHMPPLGSLTSKISSRFTFSRNRSSYDKNDQSKHSRLPSDVESKDAPICSEKSYRIPELNLRSSQTTFDNQYEAELAESDLTYTNYNSRENSDDGSRRDGEISRCCTKCGRAKRDFLPIQQNV